MAYISDSNSVSLSYSQVAASWFKKVDGQEVAIFRQTAANFRQRTLWVLKISICPKISPKWDFLAPSFAVLDENFSTRFSDNFPTVKNWGGGQLPPILPSLPLPQKKCMFVVWNRVRWMSSKVVYFGKRVFNLYHWTKATLLWCVALLRFRDRPIAVFTENSNPTKVADGSLGVGRRC